VSEKQTIEKVALNGVKNIIVIVIASGKGGVGKSTVAANLAISFVRQGYKTALMDADIYGPSIPMMFNIQNEPPVFREIEGKNYMAPVERYNISLLSLGLLVHPGKAVIWRGPMASNALMQLFTETKWGDIDVMIVDLPPGTGDIQLSVVQRLHVTGAIMVTTPQNVALADVRKAIQMFTTETIAVPLLGIVENMSWFTPEDHPNEKYYIFGSGGGKMLAKEFNIPLLAQIQLVQNVCESGEKGIPITIDPKHPVTLAFDLLVQKLAKSLK
jgi:ATP-binding protein involved in chromosome partitioning